MINKTSEGLVKALEGLNVVLGQSARVGHGQGQERPAREDSLFEETPLIDIGA